MKFETTRYELPPTGISLLGYIVRRMHKTDQLLPVPGLLASGQSEKALEQVALYTTASSTSFGTAYYQPNFNAAGDSVSEPDPATGAIVTARLDRSRPHLFISYEAVMPTGEMFEGSEEITGTTVGLRGLGMPAPSRFSYASGEYNVQLTGIITSELVPSIFRRTRIRAHGSLDFEDNHGNSGRLDVKRDGSLAITINQHVQQYSLVKPGSPENA